MSMTNTINDCLATLEKEIMQARGDYILLLMMKGQNDKNVRFLINIIPLYNVMDSVTTPYPKQGFRRLKLKGGGTV